jgi:hypothetical protein
MHFEYSASEHRTPRRCGGASHSVAVSARRTSFQMAATAKTPSPGSAAQQVTLEKIKRTDKMSGTEPSDHGEGLRRTACSRTSGKASHQQARHPRTPRPAPA